MSESEVRGAAIFYDHELEEGHPTRRRRRPAADWGVGEELFEHMPSRRRFRAGEPGARHEASRHELPRHEAPRRDPHARTRPAADFERPTDELEVPSRPDPASVVDAAWMTELAESAMPAPARRPDPEPAESAPARRAPASAPSRRPEPAPEPAPRSLEPAAHEDADQAPR